LSRFAIFFSAWVLSGFFRVFFWEVCVLAIVFVGQWEREGDAAERKDDGGSRGGIYQAAGAAGRITRTVREI
jgi:hypothetical protein